jgi:hypothetical protein
MHQLGEVLHDILQSWLTDTIRDSPGGRLVKSEQVLGQGFFQGRIPEKGFFQPSPCKSGSLAVRLPDGWLSDALLSWLDLPYNDN